MKQPKSTDMDRAKERARGHMKRLQNQWDFLIYRSADTPRAAADLKRSTFTEIATFVVHRMI